MAIRLRQFSAPGTVSVPPCRLVAVYAKPTAGAVTVQVASRNAGVATVGAGGATWHEVNGGLGSVVADEVSASWTGGADVRLYFDFGGVS